MPLKLLALAFSPLNFAIEALLAALVLSRLRRPRAAKVLASLSLAVLWASATPKLAGFLASALERRYAPVDPKLSPTADAIVVLGGALGSRRPPRLSAELVESSDRLIHAARLYRAGRAPLVVASGGNAPGSASRTPESVEMSSLLIEWGVPAEAQVLETGSVDTHQNARETARAMLPRGLKRILLVTSALHMPRAVRVFRKQGFEVVPSPTDFAVVDPERRSLLEWLPSADALLLTTAVLHERLGSFYYARRGWLG